jgi:hypothetical protein
MRKAVILAVFSALAFFSLIAGSEARPRRCHHRRQECWCVQVCVPPSAQPLARHTPAKTILQTEELSLPGGKIHRLHTIDDMGWQEPVQKAKPQFEGLAGTPSEVFAGNDREAAKTSLAMGNARAFADLSALIDTLESDDDMRNNHNPPISKARMSGRVAEENRNVTVMAFLVATKKENDNDYHLILANTPEADGPYLTAEVSGLPRMGNSQDKTVLQTARNQYKQLLNDKVPGPRYKLVDPPMAVTVTGSMFYDMDHPAGAVGTGDFVPATSWEIHPITSITHAQ